MKSSVDFAQRVSAVGYVQVVCEDEYLSGEKCVDEALIDPRWANHDARQLSEATAQDPMMSLKGRENALLFRTFTDLDTGVGRVGDIIEFASRYGLLGIPAEQTVGGTTRQGLINPFNHRDLVIAERTEEWCDEIRKMREALRRFDLVLQCGQDDLEGYRKLRAKEQLRQLFEGGEKIQVDGVELIYSGDKDIVREDFKNFPEIVAYCDKGDFERAERAYVGLLVNRELHKHTSLTLAWNLQEGKHKLQYRTTKLVGALWLQFAEYITEVRRLNFCRVCGKPIPIVGRSARDDKDLCGNTCRKRASRSGNTVRRRKEAFVTRTEGDRFTA